MAVLDDHKLAMTVPYAIVRHPSYTGWLIMVAGNFLLLFSEEFVRRAVERIGEEDTI
ncbi:hypothetical protein L227DRAFT_579568 [Lentinus tigrinus ALCF2SS1-6]|uniref:Protein-S-isoprenylcysteine O-methyltransferase n=2 Tax=Lentinus tigrinus TaxID=5365 RepID=A0A5C2RX84_9APHY|nr:hypothetical protein L227DRAFT_579568 [Lentinus tigrinus ALCF2SS1-6]